MAKKLISMVMALLVCTVVFTTSFGYAESEEQSELIARYIEQIKETPDGHVVWDVLIPDEDPDYAQKPHTFTTPSDDGIGEEEALSIAVDTLMKITGKSIEDIYNGYEVRFLYGIEGGNGRHFWRVRFEIPAGSMGTRSYSVDVSSTDGEVIHYWVNPS